MDSDKLLGEFLRARREVTTPDELGLPRFGQRRTPGLRREEVAMLAGVSTDYYIRLEQGRERHPSEQVLSALAKVLDLDADATMYLHEIAHPQRRQRAPRVHVDRVNPNLLRLMRSWRHTPALVIGRWLDVLATNPLAAALYGGLDHNDNLLRLTFLNPLARSFFADWEKVAAAKAAHLRAAAGADPNDPYLPILVGELSLKSEEFRRLWARHDVRTKTHEAKRFCHREVGELTLGYESFTVNSAPGQQLLIYQAEPGSPSEHALTQLGRLAAQATSDFTPAEQILPVEHLATADSPWSRR
jgi:transcriptional regulator with XRE-family HTH domain